MVRKSGNSEGKNWIDEQNEATQDFLATYPEREKVKEKLTKSWNYPKYSVPQKEGDYFYFHKNDGLQNQAVFYRTKDLDNSELEVIIDPNTLNDEGTAAITNLAFTKDGNRLAYGISLNGSDWQEIRIRDLQTDKTSRMLLNGANLAVLLGMRTGSGFYYNRFPEPGTVSSEDESNYNRVYWHTVGTVTRR